MRTRAEENRRDVEARGWIVVRGPGGVSLMAIATAVESSDPVPFASQ